MSDNLRQRNLELRADLADVPDPVRRATAQADVQRAAVTLVLADLGRAAAPAELADCRALIDRAARDGVLPDWARADRAARDVLRSRARKR